METNIREKKMNQTKGDYHHMKKFGAVILAVMMIVTAGLAYASEYENMTGENGVIGEFDTLDTAESKFDSVIIYKEITAYNPETCTVNAPTITYNYTIGGATVASGTTVTDNASRHKKINNNDVNVSVAVKAGVGNPTITGTGNGVLAVSPTDQLSASEYGTANRFGLTVDFSGVNWATAGTGAGVYRYVITETTTAAIKNAAGIAEGTTPKTLYMDVYVDGTGNIYGYVLFANNDSIDGSGSEAAAASSAGKTEGFVDDADDHTYSSSDASTADKYFTFNFEVKKDVVNDAYAVSSKHQFPFDVSFANNSVTAAVLPKVTASGDYTYTIPTTAGAITTFSADGTAATPSNNLQLADDAVISFVGIPCGTTVTIKEKNNVTGVTYTASITNADTNGAAKAIDTGATSNDAVINCTSYLQAATENHTAAKSKQVLFTNTLLQISPTGYVVRYAPYALMLLAGIALLVIVMKHRRNREDED